jgi:endonuclease/exonuclease/phosphatase (EEP) superfamily protein YafD
VNTARRLTGTIVGVLLLAIALAAFAVRYTPLPNHMWLYAAVAAPFLLVTAPLAFVVLLWGRRWLLGAIAAGLTVVTVAVQIPFYVVAEPDRASVPVRVMTINMLDGRADTNAITAMATDQADVLMVQEFTPKARRRLEAAGIERIFPHHRVEPRPAAMGTGIYSRYPITTSARIDGLQRVMISARLRIEGVAIEPTVASVHLASPWPHRIDGWHHDFDVFPGILAKIAADNEDGSIVIAGDFNATIDMRPFRSLLDGGYRDASEQAGEGRQFTYPGDSRGLPFMGLDHVLTRNATAVSTETVTVSGSDHRALLATVLVPRD